MPTPIKLIIVEDSDDDALQITRALVKSGYEPSPRVVQTEKELLGALKEGRWELVISDYSVPTMPSGDALHVVKAFDPDVPFIVVSEALDEEQAVNIMRAGANDCISKSNMSRLGPAVSRELREAVARGERHALELQLRHSQRLESLGTMASGIAHDFNNILAVILGNLSLARSEYSDLADLDELLEQAEMATMKAKDLVQQMLAMSGKSSMTARSMDLTKMIEGFSGFLQTSLSKKVVLEEQLDPDLPFVEADPTLVKQLLTNLVTNASEAIGDDEGSVVIKTGKMDVDRAYLCHCVGDPSLVDGTYCYIQVKDTGVGMDSELQARIFEPFMSTKFLGRGLGMASVLGIMKAHKGAVRVQSRPGKGATVRLLFPAVKPSSVSAIRSSVLAAKTPVGGRHILVVDDEPGVQLMARRALERAGYKVMLSSDGLEALEQFKKHGDDIALVLLDLKMPRMDGKEAMGEIRKLREDVPIILSSGHDHTGDPDMQLLDHFLILAKPYLTQELIDSVIKLLGQDVSEE